MQSRSCLAAAELIAERPDERLDTTRLEPYLRARLPGAEGPLSVAQFHGGKANLTYLLRFGDSNSPREFVLRRPPLGPIPPGAHDMRREHRVLSALHRRYTLAPQSLLLCEDESVIGAVFIVEERRVGFVIRDDLPGRVRRPAGTEPPHRLRAGRRAGRAARGRSPVKSGSAISAGSRVFSSASFPAGPGAGKPRSAGRRRPNRAPRWRRCSTGSLARCPKNAPAALLHNDYRLDNCLLDTADPGRIVAVLDWDMCTQGDPLADLGYVLNYWVEPGDDPAWRAIASMPTWRDGFPSRAEAIARYAARTGSDVGDILWYQVFAAFKLAVIIQQIYIRYVRGQTQDRRFASYAARVIGLANKAQTLIG